MAAQRERSASSGTLIQASCRKTGTTSARKRRKRDSDRGESRAFTKCTGTSFRAAAAIQLGQTSASTSAILAGRIAANARRTNGGKSSGA